MNDPTQEPCPKARWPGGTHHLVPRAGVPTCVYCGKTRSQLVEAK